MAVADDYRGLSKFNIKELCGISMTNNPKHGQDATAAADTPEAADEVEATPEEASQPETGLEPAAASSSDALAPAAPP